MGKELIFIVSLFIIMFSCTDKNNSIKNEDINKKTTTIRLLYPQWQGGSTVGKFITELPADDANRGYYMGAQLLNFLAPESSHKTVEVPVSLDINDISAEYDVVGLTIAESLPKVAIKLKNMLNELPLLKE